MSWFGERSLFMVGMGVNPGGMEGDVSPQVLEWGGDEYLIIPPPTLFDMCN